MSIIRSRNILAEQSQYTFLSQPEVAGTTSLRVINTAGMTDGWAIQIGNTGEEYSEVVIGTVAAAGSLTNSALSFAHPANTPVSFIKYNQVVFERSTVGTAGTAAPMTNGTITIQADSETTNFDDTSAASTYAYRTYFRNSALAVNSDESAWITPAGFSVYSLGSIRQRQKDKLWNANFVSDSMLDSWTNEFLEMMNNAAVAVNEDYSLGTADVSFGTDGQGTITDPLFKSLRRVWVTYDGSSFVQGRKMFVNDYNPDEQFNATNPYFYQPGDNVIGIKPDNAAGTARIMYYKNPTILVDDDDLLPFPMRGYTGGFVDYGLMMAQQKDGKTQEALALKQTSIDSALSRFRDEISPRAVTGNTYVDQVESINSEDWFY